jgi:hypothetical protein
MWYNYDDVKWDFDSVVCCPYMGELGWSYVNVDDNPPENCQFYLEQVLSADKRDM